MGLSRSRKDSFIPVSAPHRAAPPNSYACSGLVRGGGAGTRSATRRCMRAASLGCVMLAYAIVAPVDAARADEPLARLGGPSRQD